MFIILSSPTEIILLIAGLLLFGLIAWREINLATSLVLFLAPLYLVKVLAWSLPLTVLELLILTLALVWLIKKVKEKSFDFGLNKNILWASGLIIIGSLVATIFSADLKTSVGIFKSWILEPMMVALIIWDTTKTKEQLKKLILSIVASSAVVAIISLIYWLAGDLTFDGRLKGFYLSPNHLAMYLAPSLIISFGLWFGVKKNWERILLFTVYCLLFIVLYLTYSYAAWLAVLLAVMFVLFFIQRAKLVNSKKLFTVYCLLFTVLLILIATQFSSPKMADLLKFDRSSVQSRLMVWQSAGQIIKDHWLVGIGPGLFQQYYLEYQKYFSTSYLEWAVPQPHSLWLAWWLQAGLLGLLGFGYLIIIFFWQTAKSFKKTNPPFVPSGGTLEGRQPLLIILAAVMIYFLAHGLADTPYWKNDLALIFWSLIALSGKAGRLFY